MPIDVYYSPTSAPCRTVFIVAEALNIKLNPILLNLFEGEHLKPEFLKLNPQHCVPTIVDDGFVLWESRAILTYLVSKYGAGSTLYPVEHKQRALVDQRVQFDMGTLYKRFADYFYPQIFVKEPPNDAKLKQLEEALGFLDTFLQGNQWVAGSKPTVADICIVSTVSHIDTIGVDISKYSNVKAWFERANNTIPGCKKTETFSKDFKKLIADFKKRNAS